MTLRVGSSRTDINATVAALSSSAGAWSFRNDPSATFVQTIAGDLSSIIVQRATVSVSIAIGLGARSATLNNKEGDGMILYFGNRITRLQVAKKGQRGNFAVGLSNSRPIVMPMLGGSGVYCNALFFHRSHCAWSRDHVCSVARVR
jgi:hypothetical protein